SSNNQRDEQNGGDMTCHRGTPYARQADHGARRTSLHSNRELDGPTITSWNLPGFDIARSASRSHRLAPSVMLVLLLTLTNLVLGVGSPETMRVELIRPALLVSTASTVT